MQRHFTLKNLATIAAMTTFLSMAVLPLSSVAAATPTISLGRIQNLSSDSATSTAPVVATVGSHVYVAWESKGSGHRVTEFRSSADGGSTWSATTSFTGNGLSGSASP